MIAVTFIPITAVFRSIAVVIIPMQLSNMQSLKLSMEDAVLCSKWRWPTGNGTEKDSDDSWSTESGVI